MPSLRRATPRRRRCTAFRTYFYPRPPCGERLTNKRLDERERNFYPRSPCGERRTSSGVICLAAAISIHALLAESDGQYAIVHGAPGQFLSTLSLRRATLSGALATAFNPSFLSTLSLRRATAAPTGELASVTDFYPRSPCGERPATVSRLAASAQNFYPRSPCGERLALDGIVQAQLGISIHALLAESDALIGELQRIAEQLFLSTLSLRRATRHNTQDTTPICISIHALLAESDWVCDDVMRMILADFYPRSPCGERLISQPMRGKTDEDFYPRSPCGERLAQLTPKTGD